MSSDVEAITSLPVTPTPAVAGPETDEAAEHRTNASVITAVLPVGTVKRFVLVALNALIPVVVLSVYTPEDQPIPEVPPEMIVWPTLPAEVTTIVPMVDP